MSMKNRLFIKKIFSGYLKLASRRRYVILLDIFVLLFAVYISYAIRYSLRLDPAHAILLFRNSFTFPLCIVSMLLLGGTYRFVWPKGSIEEYLIFFR